MYFFCPSFFLILRQINVNNREQILEIAVWLTGPTRESHETKKLQTSIPLFSYTCTCMTFEKKNQIPFPLFFSLFSFFFLTDIDECKTYPDKCHVNALCNNTQGSHVCKCKPGYTGDGRNCTGKVNNLKRLHICFDYYNEFLFVVVVVVAFFKAHKKRLEHERSVERNTRRSREAYASLLMLW